VEQPVIQFIGISEGTLATTSNDLEFMQSFEATSRDLVGVVAFSAIADGSTVQATWFSPDDRSMPMGRTSIQTASGSKVARFTLSSQEDWESSPFMLDIRAWHGEEESRLTASGSVHFFTGMTDEEIMSYYEERRAWDDQKEKQRQEQEKTEQENAGTGATVVDSEL